MAETIVALSGPVSSGKSTLGQQLVERYGAHRCSTRALLIERFGDGAKARKALQQLGRQLDEETGGSWLAESVGRLLSELDEDPIVVVDAVRIRGQVQALREAFGRRVIHVHLTAPSEEL